MIFDEVNSYESEFAYGLVTAHSASSVTYSGVQRIAELRWTWISGVFSSQVGQKWKSV